MVVNREVGMVARSPHRPPRRKKIMENKDDHYLGDGLYARAEDGFIHLYAPRMLHIDRVYLDDQVLNEFIKFIEKTKSVTISIKDRTE